ncbi:hypothetical protein F2Q69_00062682 [Brassica cretica]|uniref:Hexosyltransferase n=1 Tax=Brassica cretica TaxID=69181 RepID=A0A8S9RD25_BRACR|nr:hypothetical protein F2Q69_00062682 [Brassica cretica]
MAPKDMTVERKGEVDMVASPNDGKMAYVTFLAGNLDYWMGVVGLAKGLRKVNSAYPLVVAILPDVPEEHRQILVAQGCIVREIDPVIPPENQAGYAMAYYVINYSKLRIWEDFLNMYFKDIYKPIPTTYNLVMAMLWRHPEHVDLDHIKVVHYCAKGSKPWRFTGAEEHMDREDIKMLVKKWWEIYDDSNLDYKNLVETELKLNPIITTLASKEPVGDCLTSLAPSAA